MAKKHLDTKMFKDICKNELKQNKTVKYNCGEYEVEINVKPYSTMQEKQTIAETVWACCGGEDYHVAASTPAFRLMVLYTYCDNLKIDLGKGITAYYDLVMHTGLYNAVVNEIDEGDLHELKDIAWDYCRFMEERETKSDIDKALSSLLDTLNKKLGEVDVDGLLADVKKVAAAADDGSIVEKVLERYGQKEDERPELELVKPEGDTNGNDNGRAEESDTGEDR